MTAINLETLFSTQEENESIITKLREENINNAKLNNNYFLAKYLEDLKTKLVDEKKKFEESNTLLNNYTLLLNVGKSNLIRETDELEKLKSTNKTLTFNLELCKKKKEYYLLLWVQNYSDNLYFINLIDNFYPQPHASWTELNKEIITDDLQKYVTMYKEYGRINIP